MPQTLQQLFGASATLTGTKITIELSDFTSVGLNATGTITPSKACAAYLKWLRDNTKSFAEDATAGIAADSFDATRSFTVRGNVAQIQNPLTFNVYTPDTTGDFDPDTVY